ncbi:DUF3422 family protein [Niveispirillum fermenti]|uniref:DUF3422 family protein n=1 Tax=Niveispirillum fermenti TaxID=1233113 RepID=UPI003A842220
MMKQGNFMATGAEARGEGREHPQRVQLNEELHARPHMRVTTPARLTHIAHLTGELGADHAHLLDLCRDVGLPLPGAELRQVQLLIDGRTVKWERHTEFTAITVADMEPVEGGDWSALSPRLTDWTSRLPGLRLVACHLRLEPDTEPRHGPESLSAIFRGELQGSAVAGEEALVWTDFRLGGDGFTRILLRDKGLSPSHAGRVVQRLLEIETYRMTALLGLPLAREAGPELAALEQRLEGIVARTATARDMAEEHGLLDALTRLAAEAEGLSARCRYRFGATQAYAELVEERVRELREVRIPGLQRLGVFLERRFRPAVRTCEAVARRQAELAAGISRASSLLRTRVDVQRAEQNAEILRSLETRARTQLRIQEAVEGLSVFAISYYLLGLVKYVLEGVPAIGGLPPKTMLTAVAVPTILAAVWIGVRRLRRAMAAGE